jgi:Photosynthesis system II assembly factor YCF48
MVKILITLIIFILPAGFTKAQQIRILTSGRPVSIRGLSVVNDQTIWVSGSGGSVGISTDAGENWKWIQVQGYEKTDFRDIEAFSDQEAVIMGITEPAVILKTTDGGKNWVTTLEDSDKSVFLDAMDFSGNEAVLVGDPDKEKIYFARSSDGGKSWLKSASGLKATESGEAFFAASGSNIRFIPGDGFALVSGGKKSCLYLSDGRYPLNLHQGEQTTGANSIAINPSDPNQAFIVGGDFSHDTVRYGNSLRIQFHPFVQTPPLNPPHGYRSCVEYLNKNEMICCGTSGVDFSNDGGMHWTLISGKSFHVCRKSKAGKSVFLAGPKGAVAILEF